MKKRVLSFLLVLVMVLAILPMPAIAAGEGASLTVSGRTYRNKYVVISDGSAAAVYYINNSNQVQTLDGSAAAFAPGSYTVYYGPLGMQKNRSFYKGTFTVSEGDDAVSATLSSSRWSSASATEQYYYAESVYYNTSSFDHVDVRVAGSYVIHVGGHEYSATVSNPSVVVKVGGTQVAKQEWSGTTSYEWRKTGLNLTRSSLIEIELILTLTYTDADGERHELKDMHITYNNVNNLSKFIDAIAICDGVAGLDIRVSVADIEEELEQHTVTYEWRVYNTDGTYTTLPAGAPLAPSGSDGHETGTDYVYNTEYVTGTSFYDYDNGLLYTFHGWDTYSHSSQFNTDATAEGYTTLEDKTSIEITNDTYIYGYWTTTELEPSSAHIAIEKVFIVDGQQVSMTEAEDLWFRIDTGIDRDGDGDTLIDVDYTMIAATGEYKIPVYQYDTPFVFTEHNADVPGYTRTTTITVAGDYIAGSAVNGDSVTVTMDPVYQGENVHLGTVTYTNTYTKNVGTPVNEYPILTLIKSASDTGADQDGVQFTLYSDEACQNAVATFTTANSGIIHLDFSAVPNVTAGTYYLKETAPLAGYKADPYVYPITLSASQSVEEYRDGAYVQVTYYTLSVTVPDGSTASYLEGRATNAYYRLHIYNEPVLGSLNVSKNIVGITDDADKNNVSAVVIVHGPIARDGEGNITSIGNTWQLALDQTNNWADSISNLSLGEYLIHESFASVHGYTWNSVTYGTLQTEKYNNITSGVFKVENETPIDLTLTNTYEEWASADFYIKKVDPSGNALAGATFQLYDSTGTTAVGEPITTGADGFAHFYGYTVPAGQESITYYLKETKAPNGYYLSSTVYKVEIKAVTNGKTTYEPKITLADGSDAGFDNVHDLLTVTNYPVQGKLTVNKLFENGTIPEGMTGITVEVDGPNGFTRIVHLNAENNWNVTLEGLTLGNYTITELDANVPGYTWKVSYTGTTVSLTEANPGYTASGTLSEDAVTITNTYTRNEAFYENPTTLTVMKVGEDGTTPLTGAVFTLNRMDASGKNVISSTSFTTGAEGKVVFDLLSGFIVAGEDIDGTYILSETAAPAGYEKTDTTWTVTIQEDDTDGDGKGEVRVVLNANKNVFENFWDWIVGGVTGESTDWTWTNDVLTVKNHKKVGTLSVEKLVTDTENLYADAEYSFTLDCSDNTFDKTFTLKAGESFKIENLPWGTTYTLTENTTGAAFTSVIADSGNGKIWADETKITVTNTYAYTTHNQPLSLIKVDADDNTKVIAGAGFTLYADQKLKTPVGQEVFSDETGKLALPIATAGTYYLVETTAPAGYYLNSTVYVVTAEEKAVVKNAGTADAVTELQMHISIAGLTGTTENQIDYTYAITNTAIKPVEVFVTKVWVASEGVIHPESVEAVLYRDGKEFDTVKLSAENDWSHAWTGLTDEYTWNVDEKSVPDGYTKTVTNNGYDFTITNTKEFKLIDVSVKKVWYGADVTHPESVQVTLYRDGKAYDTVKLSAANNWSYVWEDLTDEFQWKVDDPSVPSGYNKTVRNSGYAYTITNTHENNPKTGDTADLLGLGLLTAIGIIGFGITAYLLIAPRKKKETER